MRARLPARQPLSILPHLEPSVHAPVVRLARSRSELDAALSLRREVFVGEQGVPVGLELDGLDDGAEHVVAILGGVVVGCARVRLDGGAARLERIAVRRAFRGRGIGRAIVSFLVGRARELGAVEAVLHAQAATVRFYERQGFAARGAHFMEAGIEHVGMALALGGGRPPRGGGRTSGTMTYRPIGRVRSPFTEMEGTPIQGAADAGRRTAGMR